MDTELEEAGARIGEPELSRDQINKQMNALISEEVFFG